MPQRKKLGNCQNRPKDLVSSSTQRPDPQFYSKTWSPVLLKDLVPSSTQRPGLQFYSKTWSPVLLKDRVPSSTQRPGLQFYSKTGSPVLLKDRVPSSTQRPSLQFYSKTWPPVLLKDLAPSSTQKFQGHVTFVILLKKTLDKTVLISYMCSKLNALMLPPMIHWLIVLSLS
ncbi:hypothetical protein STEG23_036983 [Scotinomys teguina]